MIPFRVIRKGEIIPVLTIHNHKEGSVSDTITYLPTSELHQQRVRLLVEASIQAYKIFDKNKPAQCLVEQVTPPPGYDLVDHWTGVDAIFNRDKTLECYGVVFRSQQPPYTYIFSFRGTDSFLDLLDDFGADYAQFSPYQSDVVLPTDLRVETGFYRVYTDPDEPTPAMQTQLFTLIDRYHASEYPIDQVLITGHSLGAALSTLFAFDMALSRPQIKAICINYASPRVGNPEFVKFYSQQEPQQHPETRTLRVQNAYDKVPCVPFEDMGYQHLPYAYLISFYKDRILGKTDIVDNHSVSSYRTVLICAFQSQTGYCSETFESDQGVKMISVQPDPATVCTYIV